VERLIDVYTVGRAASGQAQEQRNHLAPIRTFTLIMIVTGLRREPPVRTDSSSPSTDTRTERRRLCPPEHQISVFRIGALSTTETTRLACTSLRLNQDFLSGARALMEVLTAMQLNLYWWRLATKHSQVPGLERPGAFLLRHTLGRATRHAPETEL
jgi:hypothetical protein